MGWDGMAKPLSIVGLGVLCTVLAACANVPTSGPIDVDDEIDVASDPKIAGDFPAPEPGWTQEEIFEAFFDATSQYQDGYETAQKYLTADAQETWAPTSVIKITDGRPDVTMVNEKTAELSYELKGTLGPDASYLAAPTGQTEDLTVKLSKLSGEWRISKPPKGLIMSETDFRREFSVFNTYFFDPSFTYLVADPVYLPTNGPTQTLLVRQLLDGPSDWLDSSVVTQFPDGTQLGVSSVPIENNTATVELTTEALAGTPEERGRMAAQLTWTLSQITEITDVLAMAGRVFLLDEEPSNLSDFRTYDPAALTRDASLFAIGESGVVHVSPEGESNPVGGSIGQMPGVRELAIHPLRSEAIAVAASGTQLLRASLHEPGDPVPIYDGTELSSVSWDATGVVWAIDTQANGSSLVTLTRNGDVVPVTLTGQAGRDVEAIRVSPDGTRLALIIEGKAYVGVIKRGSGTVGAIEVIAVRRIGPEGDALDVAWSDSAKVLYYLFPMTETQEAIDVVTAAVLTAGILLVLLLGTLAWLVTRQVVTPVRMAAQVAGRFSAGELSERMVVRGKDDIAKLADSFNHMASSLQRQIGQLEELSRVQQQFVSDVSHELRTPITTVRMAADVLYETKEQFDPSVQR